MVARGSGRIGVAGLAAALTWMLLASAGCDGTLNPAMDAVVGELSRTAVKAGGGAGDGIPTKYPYACINPVRSEPPRATAEAFAR